MDISTVQETLDPTRCTGTINPLLLTILISLTLSVLCESIAKLLTALVGPEEETIHSPAVLVNAVLEQVQSPPAEDVCAICVDKFVKPVQLPCRHVYCNLCIRTSLSQSDECPLCRRNVFEVQAERAAGFSMRRLKTEWEIFRETFVAGFVDGFAHSFTFAMLAKLVIALSLNPYVNMTTCWFGYRLSGDGFAETLIVLVETAVHMARWISKVAWRYPFEDVPLAVQGGIYGGMCATLGLSLATYQFAETLSWN